METNKRTCLYDKHVALGALISPFGGFDMPIQYRETALGGLAKNAKVGRCSNCGACGYCS